MKRLILFPEKPGSQSGYQKAVAADWERISPQPIDTVVCYATSPGEPAHVKVMPRPPALSTARVINLLQARVASELRPGPLRALTEGRPFDQLFCGEVIFYRALRELYPHQPMQVRFHNLFLVSQLRNQLLRYKLPLAARLNLRLLSRLEKTILADQAVTPIFITEEERAFFHTIYPHRTAHVWPVVPVEYPVRHAQRIPDGPRLVWFGSLSHHKQYALEYFIRRVYAALRKRIPALELHVFGKGSQAFHQPEKGVTGHGYYHQEDYPFGGRALFINPDLLGGGVKLKIADWLRAGLPFISTPYGVEGYRLTPGRHLLIEDITRWEDALYSYFQALYLPHQGAAALSTET